MLRQRAGKRSRTSSCQNVYPAPTTPQHPPFLRAPAREPIEPNASRPRKCLPDINIRLLLPILSRRNYVCSPGQALAVRANGLIIFVDLFLGVSLLAAPHYRPAGLAIQTAVHLAAAAFGRPDARAWHLIIVTTGLLFVHPAGLQDKIERATAWLQPAVSYDTGVGSSARRNRGGGGVRRPSRGGVFSGGTAVRRERAAARSPGAGGSGVNGSVGESSAAVPTGAGEIASEGGGGGGVRPKKKLPLQPRPSSPVAALISIYVLAQVLLPLRHVPHTTSVHLQH